MSRALRIGVTGHRWFDDVADVTRRLDEVLDDLLPVDDDAAPAQLWSALAEGADRLVIERAGHHGPIELVAVLPLDPDDYEADFATASSRAEFRRLLAEAGEIRITGPDETGTRESAYERAGDAVVEAVDVLVAVWDGEEARGQGGTGAVVEHARHTDGTEVIVVPVTRSGVTP